MIRQLTIVPKASLLCARLIVASMGALAVMMALPPITVHAQTGTPSQDRDIAQLILAAETTPAPLSVLSPSDVTAYRAVFAAQEKAQWSKAKAQISTIENPILMGYVDFQRLMHPTGYRASFSELKKWMAYYADHPQADKIYSLALKRRPRGATNPQAPVRRKWRQKIRTNTHPLIEADYRAKRESRVRQIEGRVRYLIHKKRALDGLKYIKASKQRRDLTERQFDRMQSWVAASLYYQGYLDSAKTLAGAVADRNGDTGVMAYWIDGLIAFREGDVSRAYNRFQSMANVPYQDDKLRSGAAFWAARTALTLGLSDRVYSNLDLAASYPMTFYGQLALAQLGRQFDADWSTPAVTAEGYERLVRKAPGVRRAAALSQVGRRKDADLELRWANGVIDYDQDYDLIGVAAALNLPAAQIDTALLGQGSYLNAALYPLPDYAPAKGFKTDRALLFALMRQESKFKTEATSRVGARGLMQLMPRTASFIGRDKSLQYASGRNRLYDPAFNMELGQKYVNHLLDTAARGNILHMAVAYNGGPGNLRRWRRQMEIEDPLLFIESIPNTESRDFAENVLTNLWVYRARLGQPAPTRDRIAAGELPIFEAIDQLTVGLK
ncbi:MAG: lytic transglycosylase domain-containing protein [Pseudomonadota bacterium]